jgi:hypothetical protein
MLDMTAYERYIFVLCCIVFALLTTFFVVMFSYLMSLTLKLIRHGVMDEKILIEYQKQKDKRFPILGKLGDFFVCALVCVAMLASFAFSLNLKLNEDRVPENAAAVKVVKSSSMATKYEKNTHLEGVDNQVGMFDLILVHSLPDEMDLQVNDIVLYEADDGELILHRIVKIEEPNTKHPDVRWFTLQGDAVPTPDRIPVGYVQMKGIYRNESIPMVGSFVMFMQSPAGYLCILLILIAMIATPIMEGVLRRAKRERLKIICAMGHLRKARIASVQVMIFETCDKNPLYHLVAVCYWRWLRKQLDR